MDNEFTRHTPNMNLSAVHVVKSLRREAWRVIARLPFGATHECCVCGHKVRRFLPYRGGWADVPPDLRRLGIIGSDVDNFECPVCGCHDRERHLYLYLRSCGLANAIRGARVLHFAPEQHLATLIRNAEPSQYVQADLFPTAVHVQKMDLLAIPCADESFDFVIANHVLEHVPNDRVALSEIARVLRIGGRAILQTPFAQGLAQTLQDPTILTDEARLQAYGQEDHCRLFGRDFLGRVEAAGFSFAGGTHQALLPDLDARRAGVNAAEPFLLFTRQGVL